MKRLVLVFTLLMASAVYAAMTSTSFSLEAGERRNLVSCVPWPVEVATARFDPPAKVNGSVTGMVGFCQDSTVIVEGPTTVTLEYGTPEVAQEPEQ